MLYKKLFKLNSDGKSIQTWEIHHDNAFESFWTISGRVDGKMVEHKPTHVTPKVKRNQEEQCRLEMDSKISKQVDKKYVEDITKVKQADQNLVGYSAMLAKKWEDHGHKVQFPCVVQPKLDGIRCLATKDGFFTRNRKVIEACAHIREALEPFFERFPDAQLDGELYAHEFSNDFEKIVSAVRKTGDKVTEDDLELQRKVQYHIYDTPKWGSLDESAPFVDRFTKIYKYFTKESFLSTVRVVETHFGVPEDDLMSHYYRFVNSGYEGMMVRNEFMPYEGKRTANLLKMKDFQDEEFKIIDVLEGKGNLKGHAASFLCEMKDGKTFKAKLKGSVERLKAIFDDPSLVMNKMTTVTYQNLTRDGIPRFPVAKSVRGLEDKSDWL